MGRKRVDIDTYFDRGFRLDSRTVTIFGGITNDVAARVIMAIDCLEAVSAKRKIKVVINSEGGNWVDALAIYDRLKAAKCPVYAYGLGEVSSSASAIFQAAKVRHLAPNCRMLIHDGTEGFEGNVKDFEAAARKAKDDRRLLYQIYASRSGKPVSFWEELCVVDRILNAKDAVKIGLADKVTPISP